MRPAIRTAPDGAGAARCPEPLLTGEARTTNHIKIAGFGIARIARRYDHAGTMFGTPASMHGALDRFTATPRHPGLPAEDQGISMIGHSWRSLGEDVDENQALPAASVPNRSGETSIVNYCVIYVGYICGWTAEPMGPTWMISSIGHTRRRSLQPVLSLGKNSRILKGCRPSRGRSTGWTCHR